MDNDSAAFDVLKRLLEMINIQIIHFYFLLPAST